MKRFIILDTNNYTVINAPCSYEECLKIVEQTFDNVEVTDYDTFTHNHIEFVIVEVPKENFGELDKWQKHIILYCKGHYGVNDVDFITGIQRIWAVRNGYDVEHIDNSSKENIADNMYRILQITSPRKLTYFWQIIHKEVSKTYLSRYEGLNTIETLIMLYRSEIMMLQVKEEGRILIDLPKPQKRLFNRIIRGNGRYKDYELVK